MLDLALTDRRGETSTGLLSRGFSRGYPTINGFTRHAALGWDSVAHREFLTLTNPEVARQGLPFATVLDIYDRHTAYQRQRGELMAFQDTAPRLRSADQINLGLALAATRSTYWATRYTFQHLLDYDPALVREHTPELVRDFYDLCLVAPWPVQRAMLLSLDEVASQALLSSPAFDRQNGTRQHMTLMVLRENPNAVLQRIPYEVLLALYNLDESSAGMTAAVRKMALSD